MKHVNEASVPWLGSCNEFPPNFKECTSDEFWELMQQHYHTVAWALKYLVHIDKNDPWYGACMTLFVNQFDNTGFGFVKEIERARYVTPKRYFTFGACVHNYVEYNGPMPNCMHRYTCSKCRHSYTVDSSG